MAIADILTGPVQVWYAPVGEPFPDPNTIGAGDEWGGNWVKLGYTKTPLSAEYKSEEKEVFIQEALGPVKRWRSAESLTLETSLAELTAANFGLAVDEEATVTNPGQNQVGREDIYLGGTATLTERAWGFEGTYTDEDGNRFPVRVFVYKGTATLNGALEFGKEDYPAIPLQVKALQDVSQPAGRQLLHFQRVTALATG